MPSAPHQSPRADRRADRRHAKQLAALLRAVLQSPGATEPGVRQAIFRGTPQDGPIGAYVELVRGQSYRVSDEDVQRLLESGMSQDAIFEVTVVAALGAATERLEVGMRAVREGR
jgi:alkylhydroperoxidase family enzyme